MKEPATGSVGAVIVTWLFVVLPAAWGVTQTVKKSLPLFSAFSSSTPAATSNPSSSPTTSP